MAWNFFMLEKQGSPVRPFAAEARMMLHPAVKNFSSRPRRHCGGSGHRAWNAMASPARTKTFRRRDAKVGLCCSVIHDPDLPILDGNAAFHGLEDFDDLKFGEPGLARRTLPVCALTRSLHLAMDLIYGNVTGLPTIPAFSRGTRRNAIRRIIGERFFEPLSANIGFLYFR